MRSNSWLLLTASWAEYREALISGRSLSTISSCTDLIRGAKLGEPAPRDKALRERRLRCASRARQGWR